MDKKAILEEQLADLKKCRTKMVGVINVSINNTSGDQFEHAANALVAICSEERAVLKALEPDHGFSGSM